MILNGPALLKIGPNLGRVVELYVVFLHGALLPGQYRSYSTAATAWRDADDNLKLDRVMQRGAA